MLKRGKRILTCIVQVMNNAGKITLNTKSAYTGVVI
jgi:hypothetical protein